MATYKIYKSNYSFEKPFLLDEESFNRMRNSLPVYPQPDDINKIILEKYWLYITALFPPIFVFIVLIPLLLGSFEPLEYYKALKEKNMFFNNYYDSIYKSKDYLEYCNKNKYLKRR